MQNPAAYLTTPAQHASVISLRCLDAGHLYVMEYTADYRLDDLLTAGVTGVAELTRFVQERLLTGGTSAVAAPDAESCAFVAGREGGGLLCGRNFDCRTDRSAVLLRTRPEGGYASLSLADTGWAGYGPGSLSDGTTDLSMTVALPYLPMDGMNEAGLCVSVLRLDGAPVRQSTNKPAAMTTVLMRLALDRAKSVSEAVALFAAYDMHGAIEGCDFHFLLADAAGRSAVVEYRDSRMHVFDADAAANFYLHPSVTDGGAGRRRCAIIRSVLDYRDSSLTRTDAMALLRLLRQDGPEEAAGHTQWSAVYDLADRAMDVAVCRDYTRVFHFSLYGELDAMWG